MHELVAHFEEYHVTVEGAPPMQDIATEPISPATASSSTLESPRSVYSPSPPPHNLFPTLTSAFTPPESAFASVYVKAPFSSDQTYTGYTYCGNAYGSFVQPEGHCIVDGATCVRTPVPSYHPMPLASQPQESVPSAPHLPADAPVSCVIPSHTMAEYPDPPSNALAHDYPPTIAPTPVYARHPNLSIITDLPPEESDPPEEPSEENGAPLPPDSEGEDRATHARRRKKVHGSRHQAREKAYKCPHAGCVKSYLNANGLKYHLTKGACEVIPS